MINDNVTIQTVVYRFMELSYITRCKILERNGLIDIANGETVDFHTEFIRLIFDRIIANNLIEKVWADMQEYMVR